jgi:hypothetical protein
VLPRSWPELVVLACAASLALGLLGGFGGGGKAPVLSPERASWTLTPGVVNPEVTQENIAGTICKQGWTKTVRPPTSYTDELKIEQMGEYGRSGRTWDYQEDHLISLELGGDPSDPRNLWPEPIARATAVDSIENELNRKICSGEMTLREGQRRESELKHTEG